MAATRAMHHFAGRDACYTYVVDVSTLDPRFAEVHYRFDLKHTKNCLLGNGRTLMWRRGAVWRVKNDAGDLFRCDDAPAGVVASLDGPCSIPLTRSTYATGAEVAPIKRELAHAKGVVGLGRARLILAEVWISRSRLFAVADLSGTKTADELTRTALLRRSGEHWRLVTLSEQPNWCRDATPEVLSELHLADRHC